MRASALSQDFEVMTEDLGIKIDMRYATARNFAGRSLYGNWNSFVLHREAAKMFKDSVQTLKRSHPRLKFLVLDSLRPVSIQRDLFSFVEGTPMERYVAHPERGSVHNYGMAIDLTLIDSTGSELDMGTEFDFFGDLAEPRYEEKFLKNGTLSQKAHDNRLILRHALCSNGFHVLSTEWWHFNAKQIDYLKKNQYPRVESL